MTNKKQEPAYVSTWEMVRIVGLILFCAALMVGYCLTLSSWFHDPPKLF